MNVVLFGDSNTYGLTPYGSRYENRFSVILKNKYDNIHDIYEEGLPGRTTIYHDVRPNLCSIDNINDILEKYNNIDILVIMLGTNDYKKNNANTLEELKSAMDTLLLKIKNDINPKKILLISPIYLNENIEKIDYEYNYNSYLISLKAKEVYQDLSKKYKTSFLDASLIAKPGIDGEHFDEYGHQNLANKLIEIIDQTN